MTRAIQNGVTYDRSIGRCYATVRTFANPSRPAASIYLESWQTLQRSFYIIACNRHGEEEEVIRKIKNIKKMAILEGEKGQKKSHTPG